MFTEEESFALSSLNAAQGICSYDDSNEKKRWEGTRCKHEEPCRRCGNLRRAVFLKSTAASTIDAYGADWLASLLILRHGM